MITIDPRVNRNIRYTYALNNYFTMVDNNNVLHISHIRCWLPVEYEKKRWLVNIIVCVCFKIYFDDL